MHQSLIVRQRVDMYEESTSLDSIKKMIAKKSIELILTQHLERHYRRKTLKVKQVVGLVTLPKQINEFFYIKADVELKLALSFFPEHCLGHLKETPCTYNYRVSRTDLVNNVYFFTLELQDKANYDIKQILKVLNKSDDPYALEAINCVKGRFKVLNEFQNEPYISNQELLEVEELGKNYPFQCLIEKVNKNQTLFSQRIVNEDFNKLMGISREMMFHHLKETNSLPSMFDLGSCLKTWCILSKASMTKVKEFKTQINTYEGVQYECTIEQRTMYKRTQFNPNQIVYIEFWIFKIDDFLRKVLMNDDRIYRNQIDYFNSKNTIQEYEEFMKKMKIKSNNTLTTQQIASCGYRILNM